MKYPAYGKYKESGVAWLGVVPEGWRASPLKYVAQIKTGYAFSSDDFTDDGIPLLRIGDITREGGVDFSNAKYLPENFAVAFSKVLIRRDDIVMAMTGATIGKVGKYHYDEPALLNQRVCSFIPTNGNYQNFLWYVLSADFYLEHIHLTAFGGAQPNISDSELLECLVPVPSPTEQTAIAVFLDRETGRIDTLVAKKRQLLDRLKEKRTALISRTVTRGLPAAIAREFGLEPHTRFKDSGIEWLGEVPEGWVLKRLKYLFQCYGGGTPSKANAAFWDGNILGFLRRICREKLFQTQRIISQKMLSLRARLE